VEEEREHNRLVSACITYVAFEAFREEEFISRVFRAPKDLPLIAKEHVLLEYATSHWIHHISQSGENGIDLLSHVLELLQSDNTYIWMQFMMTFVGRGSINFSVHFPVSECGRENRGFGAHWPAGEEG